MKKLLYYGSLVILFIVTVFVTSNVVHASKNKKNYLKTENLVQACMTGCSSDIIAYDSNTRSVEGLTYINCGRGTSDHCEFYTLFSIAYQKPDGTWSYIYQSCSGGAIPCGYVEYPVSTGFVTLSPGYNYLVVFSVYDVNYGCGTCSAPIFCSPSCSTSKYITVK